MIRAGPSWGGPFFMGAAVSGLILESGKRVRTVRPSYRSWTSAKQKAFLAALGESCNVKLAARKAGLSTSQAYVRRAKDASFRAGWDQALAAGYAQLEMMLLERALHGVEKRVTSRDGTTTVMREYSDRVALALLRMHRENASFGDEQVEDAEWEEARERIVERLQRLRDADAVARDGDASTAGSVETKAFSGVDRGSGERLDYRGGAWEAGIVMAQEVRVDGQAVLRGRQGPVADPSGGTVVDSQCRAAVSEMLAALRVHGLID